MIGINDWGFLPNPGSGSRPRWTQKDIDETFEASAEGVPETGITNHYIRMLEDIWEQYYEHSDHWR